MEACLMAIVAAERAGAPAPFELATVKAERAHDTLVERGARWLRGKGCKLILREFVAAQEIPDVIGWRGTWGASYLIECKTSRSDFLKDRNKPWRVDPEAGMGTYRYFLCPPRMIKPEKLPPRWGLLYAHQKVITLEAGEDPARVSIDGTYRFDHRNRHHEMQVLLSALNRLHLHHGSVAFDDLVHATYPSKRGQA
jgi:hypothetical protein